MIQGFDVRLLIRDHYEAGQRLRGAARKAAPAVARYVRDTIRKRIPPENTSRSGMSNPFPGYAATGRMKNTIVASPVEGRGDRQFNVRVGIARNARVIDRIKLHVHEYGKIIRPRRAPYLVFRNEDGNLVFTQRVRIRAKRFFRSGWDEARRNYGRVMAHEMERHANVRLRRTTRR